jgi:hypothetical protein
MKRLLTRVWAGAMVAGLFCGVTLAADSQVFFTLGALLAASKTPL